MAYNKLKGNHSGKIELLMMYTEDFWLLSFIIQAMCESKMWYEWVIWNGMEDKCIQQRGVLTICIALLIYVTLVGNKLMDQPLQEVWGINW